MKNILRSRPRTVANRPTSGGWGNKKCFSGRQRPANIISELRHTKYINPALGPRLLLGLTSLSVIFFSSSFACFVRLDSYEL